MALLSGAVHATLWARKLKKASDAVERRQVLYVLRKALFHTGLQGTACVVACDEPGGARRGTPIILYIAYVHVLG